MQKQRKQSKLFFMEFLHEHIENLLITLLKRVLRQQ